MNPIGQKTIEQYMLEFQVPESHKEKVIMATTGLVYERNQHVILWEKETQPEEKQKMEKKIQDEDGVIRTKITDILAGRETEIPYDF